MNMYDRIRELRIKNGMSQEDLARKVGYKGRSMIARVEAGQVDISQRKIIAFAEALNVTTDYLMDGTEAEPEENQIPEDKKILFRLVEDLDPQDVRRAVALLEALKKTNPDYGE